MKYFDTFTGIGGFTKAIQDITPDAECEKLQGFPIGWTEYGLSESISDTQRYKCIGNAVTVNVVKAIISKL